MIAQEGSLWVAAPGLSLWDLYGAAGERIPFLGRWEAAERVPKLGVTWLVLPVPCGPSSQEHIASSERLLCTSLTGGCTRDTIRARFSVRVVLNLGTKRIIVRVWGFCWVGVAGAHQPRAGKWSMSLVLDKHALGFTALWSSDTFINPFATVFGPEPHQGCVPWWKRDEVGRGTKGMASMSRAGKKSNVSSL